MDDFALIDEISGLNDFLRNHMNNEALSETQKERIRAHMIEYKGPKDKQIALNEISIAMLGDGRWSQASLSPLHSHYSSQLPALYVFKETTK